MAAPHLGIVDSVRSLLRQQLSVVTDYICVPIVMFRPVFFYLAKNCQI